MRREVGARGPHELFDLTFGADKLYRASFNVDSGKQSATFFTTDIIRRKAFLSHIPPFWGCTRLL
jgi:hypothetical protein